MQATEVGKDLKLWGEGGCVLSHFLTHKGKLFMKADSQECKNYLICIHMFTSCRSVKANGSLQ